MGLFNLLRTLATSGRKMEYLKTNFPEGWQLGEEEAEWHFRKLTESEASGKLEEEWGLLRLPQTSEEVRLYISKYALPIAIESLGTEIANRAGTPVAIAEDAMEAFGMAYAMKLSDLLDARKESRKEDAMKFFKKDLGKLYQQFKGKSNTNEVLTEILI